MSKSKQNWLSNISRNILGIHPRYGKKYIVIHFIIVSTLFILSILLNQTNKKIVSLLFLLETLFLYISYHLLKGATFTQIRIDIENAIKSLYTPDFIPHNLFSFKDIKSSRLTVLYVCPIHNEIYIQDSSDNKRIVYESDFYKVGIENVISHDSNLNKPSTYSLFKIYMRNKGVMEFGFNNTSYALDIKACIEQCFVKPIQPQIIHNSGIIHNGDGNILNNEFNKQKP